MKKLVLAAVAIATLGLFSYAQAAKFYNKTYLVCSKGKCYKNSSFAQEVTVLGKGGKFDVKPGGTVIVPGLKLPPKYYAKLRPYGYMVRVDADSKPMVYFHGKDLSIYPLYTFYTTEHCTYTIVTKKWRGQYVVGLLNGTACYKK